MIQTKIPTHKWFGHDFPAGHFASVRSFLIWTILDFSCCPLLRILHVTLANWQRFGFEFHLRASPSAFSGYMDDQLTYRILHGKCACTVFTHELWRIRNRISERSERERFLIQNNECVNTVQSTFHVVLCLLYTYWDWTPSLNYDKLYLKKCGPTTITEKSSFVKSERAQIKSKPYEIKLAYRSSRPFSRNLTPQFEFFSIFFLFLLRRDRNFKYYRWKKCE